jgi:hypothetical protein
MKMFATTKRSAILGLRIKMFSKLDYLEKYTLFTLGYFCKPVLESADDNVYNSKKKCHMRFRKKCV